MHRSHHMPHWIARLSTITSLALTTLGISALVTGTALYDSRVLAFPILVQIAVLAGEVGLGSVPCILFLRAAQLVSTGDVTRARNASVAGGLVLIPGIGAAALFRIVANPCWDNPSCTGGPSFADSVLKAGILVLLLAVGVALLVSPILLSLCTRPAEQRSQ